MLTYATIYQYINNQQTYFKRIIYLRQKYVKSSDSLAFTPPTLYFCISQTGQRMDGLQRALISDIPYSLYCMKTLLLTIKSFNIMKKRLPLITLRPLAWILFLLITASGYAQESLIQGLVIDENGEPLIGVSIQDQKTQKGTISDIDGKFSLEARIGNMLKISYIGYRTVTLAAAKDMRVVMSEDNMKLDEVVVVGYGVQKKVNLTGAVASVKSDEILKAQSANTSNALIGQIPGLIAKQTTGEPGLDGSQIYIRGVATFQGGTSPTYIIDGIERQADITFFRHALTVKSCYLLLHSAVGVRHHEGGITFRRIVARRSIDVGRDFQAVQVVGNGMNIYRFRFVLRNGVGIDQTPRVAVVALEMRHIGRNECSVLFHGFLCVYCAGQQARHTQHDTYFFHCFLSFFGLSIYG